jgi:lysophospholipase L1-like esterase
METVAVAALGLAGAALGAALRPHVARVWRELRKHERPVSPDQRARWTLLAELDARGALEDRVVLWGDSLFQQGDWEGLLTGTARIANRGVSGDRSEHLAERVARSGSGKARRHVVLVGVNDWWHSEGRRDLTESAARIDALARELADDGVPVHVLEPLPVTQAGPQSELAPLRRALAERADGAPWRWVPTSADFADSTGRLRRELTRDGIHLSFEGYRVLAFCIAALDPELKVRPGL